MKHAFILNPEHGTIIALMGSASMHQLDAQYGNKFYDVNEKNAYGSLMFETNFTQQHNLSVGWRWLVFASTTARCMAISSLLAST